MGQRGYRPGGRPGVAARQGLVRCAGHRLRSPVTAGVTGTALSGRAMTTASCRVPDAIGLEPAHLAGAVAVHGGNQLAVTSMTRSVVVSASMMKACPAAPSAVMQSRVPVS